jgi:HEPN domain-containing protein
MAVEWLRSAKSDIILLEEIIDNDLLTHMVAFHSQQTIEKCFKALIEYRCETVPNQHDLLLLKDRMDSKDYPWEDEEILETLNELYIESRYPGSMGLLPNGKPTQKEALAFHRFSQEIFEHTCRIVGIDHETL